ncbi:M12 family metallopeptidase [Streptosporangium sp. NPDC000396]|uniref:M12 family metallopeptidase n=1 Tax=Streptosporangium sp. NPDC000396 TaxID=3366185 RepID=UPI0036AD8CED
MTEYTAGPLAGTAFIHGATFGAKAVNYTEVDGVKLFEGDIVLTDSAGDTSPLAASIGISGSGFRWPDATIPYEIDAGLPNQQRVTDAIAHWEANTRIRFVPREPAHTHFVRFFRGGGCSSPVGMRPGGNTISLGDGCGTGNAIHEIGHSVGLWHEQSREDRDAFITIVWANIPVDVQHNFLQHVTDGDDLGAYDFGSIMHYGPTAFTGNGQPTIVPKVALPPGVVMGQRDRLSAGDIAGVHALYPPSRVTIKESVKDPVREGTFKEPLKDPIREGGTRKELVKDPVSDGTRKELVKDPINDGTLKEAAKDVLDPVKRGGLDQRRPFVLATPQQADTPHTDDELVQLVEQLSAALAAAEQQRAEILAQLAEAVALLQEQTP